MGDHRVQCPCWRVTTRAAVLLLVTMTLLWNVGCWTPPRPTDMQRDRGMIYMFPGVEGNEWSLKGAHDALRDDGAAQAIYVFNWGRVVGMLGNLMAEEGNREKANQVAQEIIAYRAQYPDAPVDLIGYSGGGGMAVFVAEALPADVRLRNVVLVQCALSPTYDLTPTLERLTGELITFHSPSDWLILGAGTEVYGTMDRVYVSSAGRVGFDLERAVRNPQLRARVRQITWSSDMLWETGHSGGHLPILSYSWNREYVAPLVRIPNASAAQPPVFDGAQSVSFAASARPSTAASFAVSGDSDASRESVACSSGDGASIMSKSTSAPSSVPTSASTPDSEAPRVD